MDLTRTVSHPPMPHPAGRAQRPDVCLKFVVACILAAMQGHSPAPALRRYASPDVIIRLEQHAMAARSRPRPAGQSRHQLRLCRVNERVLEVALVRTSPGRVRTVALRMERDRGSWQARFIQMI
ncbi:MAG: Rv3235 family protein [Micrococcales bacterium]|nr:Rv3235 family protein [Micrococcales bacterium]